MLIFAVFIYIELSAVENFVKNVLKFTDLFGNVRRLLREDFLKFLQKREKNRILRLTF